MANGRLGTARPSANVNTSVYTCNVLAGASVTIMAVNTGPTDAVCRVALVLGSSSPGNNDWIENGLIIPANGGVFERNGVAIGNTEQLVVGSDSSDVVWRIVGYES